MGEWIKRNRIFSIVAFAMNSILFYQVAYWAMSQDLATVTTGGAALVAAVMTPIAATYKFVLEFAKSRMGDGGKGND